MQNGDTCEERRETTQPYRDTVGVGTHEGQCHKAAELKCKHERRLMADCAMSPTAAYRQLNIQDPLSIAL
jgi:hypothetical protein